jgi:hypothetical protein
MSAEMHPVATHHVPVFIAAPGQSDILMTVTAVILVVAVLAVGILFLRLHTLPERLAHKGHKLQFEIVAVLGLLALFTHMHIFWVAGLLLAIIDIPDFGTPIRRMATSLERLAGLPASPGSNSATDDDGAPRAGLADGVAASPKAPHARPRPVLASATAKEPTHA